MEQTRLFSEPAPNLPTNSGKRFLSRNVTLFRALVSSPTLQTCARQAVAGNAAQHGHDRNAAAPFEDRFKALLLDSDTAATIEAETIVNAAQDGLQVSRVTITNGREKTLADVIISYQTSTERVSVATNIKRLLPSATSTEGGSILSFLRLALDPTYDPANPPTTRGYAWEQIIVEWLAGRHKIQPGRDYMLLCVYAQAGKYKGVEAWPVISGTSNGGPVARRHVNRAVLEVARPTGTIAPGYDINRALASQLLPGPNPAAARAVLTSLAMTRAKPHEARTIAGKIADLTDEQVVKLAAGAA
jgi:hypothetical protein